MEAVKTKVFVRNITGDTGSERHIHRTAALAITDVEIERDRLGEWVPLEIV